MSELIQPHGDAKARKKKTKIIKRLQEEYSADDLLSLKTNGSLIEYICCLVESKIKKKYKQDKKKLVIEIMNALIPSLNDQDKVKIGEVVEYAHSIGRIKKYHY